MEINEWKEKLQFCSVCSQNRFDGLSRIHFQGVNLNNNPNVEDQLTLKNLLYDINIVDGDIIGELARQIVQKCKNTVRYNNHFFYAININAVS